MIYLITHVNDFAHINQQSISLLFSQCKSSERPSCKSKRKIYQFLRNRFLSISQLRRSRNIARWVGIYRTKLLHTLTDANNHCLLSLANPYTRIVELLVWLVGTVGVSDLSLQEIVVGSLELPQTIPVCPLSISINIHLNHSVRDGKLNLLISGSRSSVHNQENGLLQRRADLLLGVSLVVSKLLGRKLDISRLVHTMHITESGGDTEHVTNLGQSFVHSVDLLRGGVELLGVNILIVNSILLSSGNTDLHLEPDLHLGHLLEVFYADGNVLLIGLFTQVKHVTAEKRLAVLGEESFISLKHTIEPGQKLLGAVIGMKHNGNTIVLGHTTNVHGKSNTTSSGCVGILDILSSVEFSSTVGDLNHNGRVVLLGSLEDGITG
mmetsp:Transcript_22653/g.34847  ORF Transcript_22653/g.34847 Transcript_22653/m.34847 type:complete len:380 (-) Transcript_22653:167-1306(-)